MNPVLARSLRAPAATAETRALLSSTSQARAHRQYAFPHRPYSSNTSNRTTSSLQSSPICSRTQISTPTRNNLQLRARTGDRCLHTTPAVARRSPSPPQPSSSSSSQSSSQTKADLSSLDVLGDIPAPSTAIDACLTTGFHLNGGAKITGGAGVLLVAGEAFAWRPWLATSSKKNLVEGSGGYEDVVLATEGDRTPTRRQWEVKRDKLINSRGVFELEEEEAWGLLKLVWPKPDLLIIGVGSTMRPISPATRRLLNSWGVGIEVQDTRNAAAQFNLLATERGVQNIAAALVPIGI